MGSLKNQRHELFANLIVQSPRTGMSNAACYRAAGYRVDEGPTCDAAASRLLSSAKVRERIDELRAPVVKKSRITVESLLAELGATVQAAREAKQFGAVNGALTLVGKLTGLLRDRLEVGSVGEFDGCKSNAEVIDKMIQDEGSARAVLDQLDHMRALVEERAASAALDVSPAQEWPTMAERRGRLRA